MSLNSGSPSLPSFLQPISTPRDHKHAQDTVYTHSENLGRSKAHCLWWPSKTSSAPNNIILFIPGNPGLVGFYEPFLDRTHTRSPDSVILAHAQLGHSPHVEPCLPTFSSLDVQVAAVIEVVDALRSEYGHSAKLVLIGHSVGSWIIMQAMKERSERIDGCFLLFPTITHIQRTPNGRRLSWLFRPPNPEIISTIGSSLYRFFPSSLLAMIFGSWPMDQTQVLHDFLRFQHCIHASLSMAHDEMRSILDLDVETLNSNKEKIWIYLADLDDWVGDENKRLIIGLMAEEPGNVRIVHGERGIPHAYCINHSVEVADQCLEWLQQCSFSVTQT